MSIASWITFLLGIFAGLVIGRLSFVDHYFDTYPQIEVFGFPILAVATLIIVTVKNNRNLFKLEM
jgi:ABC-type nitrate/sulfonate/bicarbonate transport system permease component